MPLDKPNFIQTQHQFTQYIRSPESAPLPTGIEKRRAEVYRDLLFNNIENFLADNFPVLRQITSDQDWQALARDFFSQHSCQSPYFADIPGEFIDYLQNHRINSPQAKKDYPFMLELAHYEWVELVVSINDEPHDQQAIIEPKKQPLTVASSAWPLCYQYPVHEISASFLPAKTPAQATYLVVYRNSDDEVVFLTSNPMTHALLNRLSDNKDQLIEPVLKQLAIDTQHPNPSLVMQGGTSIVEDFISRGIIISAS
jgi:hypothetical protein|tara:strand:- start:1110 stop:1874 length:765 start_codon:yes stop_codon:yes gene_type:complete